MFFKIYKYLSNILTVPIFIFFLIRLFKFKETSESICEKFGFYKKVRTPGKLIWINAVSIGEALSIIPIIKRIEKEYPKCKILLTTSTLTSKKLIEKRSLNVIHQFSPVDISFVVIRFLNYWTPNISITVESEFWPNLILEAKKKKITSLLINARISNKSFLRWNRLKGSVNNIFNSFSLCLTQDNESGNRLKLLGVKKILDYGNLKFFSKSLPFNIDHFNSFKKELNKKFVLLIASSHRGEEKMLISIHERIKAKIPNVLFVILPRHAHRSSEIQKILSMYKKKYAVRSKNEKIKKDTEFYLADTFGETNLFFNISQITIIGGSIIKHGGQNPIEPSFSNTAVLFGPHMFNFKNISEQLINKSAAIRFENEKDLLEKIIKLKNNKNLRSELSKNLKIFCKKEREKEEKFWSKINHYLKQVLK